MMSSKWTSLNPPPPSSSKRDKSISIEGEKQFLNLLKKLEREIKDGNDDVVPAIETEVLGTLSSMEHLYLRRGLLEYDADRADDMQTKMNDQYLSQSNSGGKKRRRGGGGASGSIASILGIDAGNDKTSVGKEAYVLSNLCRIVIPTSSSSSDDNNDATLKYPTSVINAACNVLLVICNHCRTHLPSATAALEYSLFASIASQLLSGISRTTALLMNSNHDENIPCTYKALSCCCKFSSSLIALIGNRLSRNVKAMENVRNAAEALVWYESTNNDRQSDETLLTNAKESAAVLIATIPLASNSNSESPSKLWAQQLYNICQELHTTLITFYPNASGRNRRKRKEEELKTLSWIETIKNGSTSQAVRVNELSLRLDGYVSLILSFLKMDKHDSTNCSITFALPMKCLLNILEIMVPFSTQVESKFFATKPVQRDISVEGGLLSPKAALTIANSVKYQGHLLTQAISSFLSTSTLDYGQQFVDLTLSSLQASSSNTLRKVIDPVSLADKNSHKKWLHSSVSLRSIAVESFICVLQRLGSNSILSMRDAVSKGLVYIIGMAIEQLSDENDIEINIEREHWGTERERAKLVEICVDALSSSVSIFGGYLPLQEREMLESFALTCLQHISTSGSVYCNNPSSKAVILQFGVNCVSTPCQDGSASSIISILRQTASALKFDINREVSSLAYSACNICNSITTLRAPPLVIVKRDRNLETLQSERMGFSLSQKSITAGIENERENIIRNKREVENERENKRNKREKEKSTNIPSQPGNDRSKIFKPALVQSEFSSKQTQVSDSKKSVIIPNNGVKVLEPLLTRDKEMSSSTKVNTPFSNSKKSSTEQKNTNDPKPEMRKDDSSETDQEFPDIVDCDPDDDDEDME